MQVGCGFSRTDHWTSWSSYFLCNFSPCLQLLPIAEVDGRPSHSELQRNDSFVTPPIDSCCNTRCRPGNWVNKLPTYVSMSICHVLFGTKLNWLLLCVPLAIVGAQGVFGHVSSLNVFQRSSSVLSLPSLQSYESLIVFHCVLHIFIVLEYC